MTGLVELGSLIPIKVSVVNQLAEAKIEYLKQKREEKFAAFCDKFRRDNTRPARLFGLIKAKTCNKSDYMIRNEILAGPGPKADFFEQSEFEILRLQCGLFSYQKNMIIAETLRDASETGKGALTTLKPDDIMYLTVNDYEWIT